MSTISSSDGITEQLIVCMCVCVFVRVHVFVCEREREKRERKKERESTCSSTPNICTYVENSVREREREEAAVQWMEGK